jgi:hypothetical protein
MNIEDISAGSSPTKAEQEAASDESDGDCSIYDCEIEVNDIDELLFDPYFTDIESDAEDEFNFDDIEEQEVMDIPYRQILRDFVVSYRFKHYQIRGILEFLRNYDHHTDLPISPITLLRLSKLPLKIREVEPGEYHHIGITNNLKISNYNFLQTANEIVIDICIDGVPLVKSSKLCMWPILGSFVNKREVKPFLIGLYVGNGSPKSIEAYLKDLVEELKLIKENGGIEINGNKVPFRVRAFCCDAPARAFLAGVKYHTAFHGCSKCTQVGRRVGGKRGSTVYSNVAGTSRTDEDFSNRACPQHHNDSFVKTPSSLETLGIGMVSQIPIEPMHLLDLGVMKKLLIFYTLNHSNRFFPSKNAVKETENLFLGLKPFVPAEFSRGPRPFCEVPRFKATEFRQFLLYTGPVVLKPFMKPEHYSFFLYFHCAVRLMYMSKNLDAAEKLISLFVLNFNGPFPERALTYNVHSLLHLGECVRQFGLESMSNYKFENFMQNLKASIGSSSNVIRQIVNSIELGKFMKPHPNASKTSQFDSLVLNAKPKNNHCLLKDGSVVKIFSLRGDVAVARKYPANALQDFFSFPLSSTEHFDCYLANPHIEGTEKIFSIKDDVKLKFFCMPYEKTKFVLTPLIHTV